MTPNIETRIREKLRALYGDDAAYRFRLRVRREYRWERIVKEQIVPLLG